MNYKIIKQKRKTISLSLNEKGEIVVKAPYRADEQIIQEFVASKQGWIARHLKRQQKVNEFKSKFDFENKVYLLGQELKFEEIDFTLLLCDKTEKKVELTKLYLSEAEKHLPTMATEISGQCNLKFSSLKLSNSKRNWGSFDRNGNMKLNFRLVMLPKPLIEYVIIHELCHGVHLNHSKAFWEEVKSHCPDYKKRKKQLDMYSFILGLG